MAKKIAAKKKLDINRITALVRDIKEREQVKKQLEDEIKMAQDEIKQAMTDNHLEELLADVFTIRYVPVSSDRFDQKTFKADNPKLFEMYLKNSESMRFTIT